MPIPTATNFDLSMIGNSFSDNTPKECPRATCGDLSPSSDCDRLFSCSDAEPLTTAEQQELADKLGKLPPSTAEDMRSGVECLPKATRARALYNWAKRTPVPAWYRP